MPILSKPLCKQCIDKLVYKEPAGVCKDLILGVKKEMLAIKSILSDLKTPNQPAEVPFVSAPGESNKTGKEDTEGYSRTRD